MDKKMHQVTKRMQTAEGHLRKGKIKEAENDLKKAEIKNESLVKIDRDIRDPQIDKMKKIEKVIKKK